MNKQQGFIVCTLLFLSILTVGYLMGGVHKLDNQVVKVVEVIYERGHITGKTIGYRDVGHEPTIQYFMVGGLLIVSAMAVLYVSDTDKKRSDT